MANFLTALRSCMDSGEVSFVNLTPDQVQVKPRRDLLLAKVIALWCPEKYMVQRLTSLTGKPTEEVADVLELAKFLERMVDFLVHPTFKGSRLAECLFNEKSSLPLQEFLRSPHFLEEPAGAVPAGARKGNDETKALVEFHQQLKAKMDLLFPTRNAFIAKANDLLLDLLGFKIFDLWFSSAKEYAANIVHLHKELKRIESELDTKYKTLHAEKEVNASLRAEFQTLIEQFKEVRVKLILLEQDQNLPLHRVKLQKKIEHLLGKVDADLLFVSNQVVSSIDTNAKLDEPTVTAIAQTKERAKELFEHTYYVHDELFAETVALGASVETRLLLLEFVFELQIPANSLVLECSNLVSSIDIEIKALGLTPAVEELEKLHKRLMGQFTDLVSRWALLKTKAGENLEIALASARETLGKRIADQREKLPAFDSNFDEASATILFRFSNFFEDLKKAITDGDTHLSAAAFSYISNASLDALEYDIKKRRSPDAGYVARARELATYQRSGGSAFAAFSAVKNPTISEPAKPSTEVLQNSSLEASQPKASFSWATVPVKEDLKPAQSVDEQKKEASKLAQQVIETEKETQTPVVGEAMKEASKPSSEAPKLLDETSKPTSEDLEMKKFKEKLAGVPSYFSPKVVPKAQPLRSPAVARKEPAKPEGDLSLFDSLVLLKGVFKSYYPVTPFFNFILGQKAKPEAGLSEFWETEIVSSHKTEELLKKFTTAHSQLQQLLDYYNLSIQLFNMGRLMVYSLRSSDEFFNRFSVVHPGFQSCIAITTEFRSGLEDYSECENVRKEGLEALKTKFRALTCPPHLLPATFLSEEKKRVEESRKEKEFVEFMREESLQALVGAELDPRTFALKQLEIMQKQKALVMTQWAAIVEQKLKEFTPKAVMTSLLYFRVDYIFSVIHPLKGLSEKGNSLRQTAATFHSSHSTAKDKQVNSDTEKDLKWTKFTSEYNHLKKAFTDCLAERLTFEKERQKGDRLFTSSCQILRKELTEEQTKAFDQEVEKATRKAQLLKSAFEEHLTNIVTSLDTRISRKRKKNVKVNELEPTVDACKALLASHKTSLSEVKVEEEAKS